MNGKKPMKLHALTFASVCVLVAPPLGEGSPQSAADTPIVVIRSEAQTARPGPAENFTGSVRVDQAFQAAAPGRTSGARVAFEAGARTAWHSHPLGQTLIVTSGVGRVQRWGDPAEEILPGDVVWIPAGRKHWHGGSPASGMSHIAIVEQLDGNSTDWMEKVIDEQYATPVRGRTAVAVPATSGQPTRAQSLMGDFAPKLAQLTDDVLFGDVWARPQLSPRDRSLVTVSALVAMNRPDQLRSHFARARDNGLTEEQLSEAITHLAFYAGWPSAISAVTVAREVFEKVLRHPAFAGFGRLLLPWDGQRYDTTMPLTNIGSLLPYHTEVDPAVVVSSLNRMIDDESAGRTVFHDVYTDAQKEAEPSRQDTGLFFLTA